MPIDNDLASLSPEQQALYELLLRQAKAGSSDNGIPRRETNVEIPLTYAQHGLWLASKTGSDRPFRHPVAFRIRGSLDARALEDSLNTLIERHEILRTVCSVQGSVPVQVVQPFARRRLEVIDLQQRPPEERDYARLAFEETSRPFDLEKGPLWRAALYKLAEHDHIFLLVTHTFVSDGFSLGVLLAELGHLYRESASSSTPTLPAPSRQFGDYAVWQSKAAAAGALDEQLTYWKTQLEGSPSRWKWPVETVAQTGLSLRGETASFELDAEISASIRELARRQGATPFVVLLAALNLAVAGLSGRRDILIGTMVSHRSRPELEAMVGYLANNLLLRSHVAPQEDFAQFLHKVNETVLDAFANQEFPFEKLHEELSRERDPDQAPSFQVMFVMHDQAADGSLALGNLDVEPIRVEKDSAVCDFYLRLTDKRDRFAGSVEYRTDVFDERIVEAVLAALRKILRTMAARPTQAIDESGVLDKEAWAESVEHWKSRCAAKSSTAERSGERARISGPAPESELERTIAGVWKDVLGLESLGLNENVFDLGCRSLQLVQAHRLIEKRLGKSLPLLAMYEAPTIAKLARSLEPEGIADLRRDQEAEIGAHAESAGAAPFSDFDNEPFWSGTWKRLLQVLALYAPGRTSLRARLHRMRGVNMGEGVVIGLGAIIETKYPEFVSIGDGVVIGIRAVIIAHFLETTAAAKRDRKPTVRIEDRAFIGPGAIILPNVTIGHGAVVAAGSVVSESVPPQTVVRGNPARPVGRYDGPLTESELAERLERAQMEAGGQD